MADEKPSQPPAPALGFQATLVIHFGPMGFWALPEHARAQLYDLRHRVKAWAEANGVTEVEIQYRKG